MAALDVPTFAALVDHTLLKPEAERSAIVALCAEARELSTASVCVNPYWVSVVAGELAGSDVDTCSVVGFPLGATSGAALAHETEAAVADGAVEIDMVLPIGLVRAGELDAAADYLAAARTACDGLVLKVILETATLTDDEIATACRLSEDAGADFVKTSTGFHPSGGATTHAVALMREQVGDRLGIKASGGIRTLADVEAMVDAGATRLGMSATAAVIDELTS